MLSNNKVIFVSSPKEEIDNLKDLFRNLNSSEYIFVILPLDIKILTKDEVTILLKNLEVV